MDLQNEGTKKVRRSFVPRTWSQPDVRPSRDEAKRCSEGMRTLYEFISPYDSKSVLKTLKENSSMMYLLKSIPVEYFFWEAQKTIEMSQDGLHIIKLVNKSVDAYIFLAASKIELEIEEADIERLAEKYKLDWTKLTQKAANYGMENFYRHSNVVS